MGASHLLLHYPDADEWTFQLVRTDGTVLHVWSLPREESAEPPSPEADAFP
ncbi:MAG: hypothetical protein KatS3mg115_1485 [Candidatus Poribacteria bacterium]|nr:MAG: hypothetical protein KatS3mg115_1485 [Candidatus Poribacteria bacterium]